MQSVPFSKPLIATIAETVGFFEMGLEQNRRFRQTRFVQNNFHCEFLTPSLSFEL